MAGARGRPRKLTQSSTPRRSTRRLNTSQENSGVPEVFQDLLVDEQVSGPEDENVRPLKRRKTAQHLSDTVATSAAESLPTRHSDAKSATKAPSQAQPPSPSQSQFLSPSASQPPVPPPHHPSDVGNNGRVRQTIIDSDESDDSDMEWEDALVEEEDAEDQAGGEPDPEIGDISITIGPREDEAKKIKKQVRRRAITSVEKKRRLDIHKMHVLCLLYHVHRRNAWCNDRRVQATLRKIPSPKILSNLVPNPEFSQYQTSKHFIDGMNELKLLWSKRFSVTAQGMYRPRWAEVEAEVRPFTDFDEMDPPMDLDDFRAAAFKLEGSQDVGAQLFCALLRSIGIDTRLVCSLQCLPFASAAQPSTPQKASTHKNTIVLDPYNTQDISPSKPRAAGTSRLKRPSRLERAIGERHSLLSTGVAPKQKKKYHTAYPVYWIEAFNSAHQKWVPIDPLSTFTVNAPEKIEPPLNFAQSSLVYAIAFEDDYTAKDVTRRYAKAYNAKVRKFRVECTPHGDKWWMRSLKFFQRSMELDRDQLEDAALARKEAAEGIPKNVQDFKDHPVYVLERHLRHNEVIHPLNQVGKVNVGSSMNPKMEPIYRRRNVHTVRSADKWYRLGRDVKDGEQPLKHAKPKNIRRLSIGPAMDVDDQQEEVGAGLYAEFQTEVYEPPPVMRGRVPRNAYGNLDLYVPSMCPPGGSHIRHKLASKAARIVGVDYAEAVTGFSFKGRHGTAIVQGIVVAQEYAEAIEDVIDSMEYEQERMEVSQRRAEALRLWRRFYLGLRIAQRVNAIEIDGEIGPVINVQEEIEKEDKDLTEKEFAGGFFPEEGTSTEPSTRNYELPTYHGFGGGFLPDEDNSQDEGNSGDSGLVAGRTVDSKSLIEEETHNFGSTLLSQQHLRPRRTSSMGGEFMLDEDEVDRTGFMREPTPPIPGPSTRNERSVRFTIPIEGDDKTGNMTVHEPIFADNQGGVRPDTHIERKSEREQPIRAEPKVDEEPKQSGPNALPADINANIKSDVLASKESSLPSSSPSDAGSLPLEDPEDEDADPDWLVEAT